MRFNYGALMQKKCYIRKKWPCACQLKKFVIYMYHFRTDAKMQDDARKISHNDMLNPLHVSSGLKRQTLQGILCFGVDLDISSSLCVMLHVFVNSRSEDVNV